MQMQQLVSDFSAGSQRSDYFFCFYGFTLKKKNTRGSIVYLFDEDVFHLPSSQGIYAI